MRRFLGDLENLEDLVQYGFFPFTYGIYPYTTPTDKQKAAMDAMGVPYREISVYEITLACLKKLFL